MLTISPSERKQLEAAYRQRLAAGQLPKLKQADVLQLEELLKGPLEWMRLIVGLPPASVGLKQRQLHRSKEVKSHKAIAFNADKIMRQTGRQCTK